MSATLRVMVLCGQSPRHLFVANALCAAADVLAIVHEDGHEPDLRKTLRKLRPKNLLPKFWRWLRDRPRYASNGEAKFFFPTGEPALARPDLVRRCAYINHPNVVRWLDELKPDLVCVFGTSLIRGELLRGGHFGIVNLHGGLSPEYRGADCTFWALHNGEPEKVGCTLHYINEGIDTGKLIAHVCPEIRPSDDELTLFWRAVQDSAQVYAEFVRRLAAGGSFGVPQAGKGRLYRVRDRALCHERHLRGLIESGLLANCRLPRRVQWFETSA